jgi:hypothetical protein
MRKIIIIVTLFSLVIPFNFASAAFCPPIFCPPPGRDPIIIVPGILGSWNWDVFLHDGSGGTWGFMPFSNVYQPLIDALEDAGYEEGETLFVAYYDWRLQNVLSAQEYLKPIIEQAKQASGRSLVDIIAHSMGGILARAYIQGEHYDLDVHQFFLLGTPNYGSGDVYAAWEGGYIPKNWNLVKRVLLESYLFLKNRAISSSARYSTIHDQISSLRDLLPTYDYVKDKSSDTLKTTSSLAEQNATLNSFNAEINDLPFLVGSLATFAGNNTQTVGEIPVIGRDSGEEPLWADGKPDPLNPERNSASGDNTVLLTSARIPGIQDQDQLTLDNAKHTDLPSMSAKEIFSRLNLTWPYESDYLALVDQPDEILSFSFASPVAPVITDESGNQISATTNTIPGAVYFGEDDPNGMKMILIPNPADGDYKIDMTGTADGHYDMQSAYFAQDEPEASQIFSGDVTQGENFSYTAKLDAQSQDPLVTQPSDTTPPDIKIISPEPKDYLRSATLPITVNITDSGTGVYSSEIKFDNLPVNNNDTRDLFYESLGSHILSATATDFVGNQTSTSTPFRIIATIDSTVSDIERAYSLGWIINKTVKNTLIQKLKAAVKLEKFLDKIIEKVNSKPKVVKQIERIEKRIDKVLLKALLQETKAYRKKQINEQAYNIITEDINWLINN